MSLTTVPGTAVLAQDDDSTVPTDEFCVTQEINAHMWGGGPSASAVIPLDIPAGTVRIPEAVARDFYQGRQVFVQPSERWQLLFLDADGTVIARSEPTGDVPDGEDDQTWAGPLADVELASSATAIQAIHRPDLPSDGQAMSVWASGITLCWDVAVPPEPTPPAGPIICPDADGETVVPMPDGTCPEPEPVAPTQPPVTEPPATQPPATEPPPAGPVACSDDAGNVVEPNADGTCPTLDPAGPSLPVTGTGTVLFIALAGVFLTAAGINLVLRPDPIEI